MHASLGKRQEGIGLPILCRAENYDRQLFEKHLDGMESKGSDLEVLPNVVRCRHANDDRLLPILLFILHAHRKEQSDACQQ